MMKFNSIPEGIDINTPFFRTGFNYDTLVVSKQTSISDFEPTLTQQHFKDECDINEILRQFNVTGQLPENVRVPQYGDFTGVFDYQSALNAVINAKEGFMALPADIRAMFGNDPQGLLEFVADDANYAKAVALGLIEAKSDSETAKAVDKADAEPPAA